jgi:hypothetical protein
MPEEQPKPFVMQLYDVMLRNMRREPLAPEEAGLYKVPDAGQAKILNNLSYFLTFKMHAEKPYRTREDPTNTSYPECGQIVFSPQLARDLAALVFDPSEAVKKEFLKHPDVYTKFQQTVGAFIADVVPETEFKTNPKLYAEAIRAAAIFKQENNGPENSFWRAKENPAEGPADAAVRSAEKVPSLTPGRPTLIYFGGMHAMSEQQGYIDRVMTRLGRFVSPQEYSLKDFDIVTVTYANGAATHKTANIYAYQDNPKEFYSAQAKYFVDVGILPLIATMGEGGMPERFPDAKQLEHNLSMLSIIGYSYGTLYVQEFRNALKDKLNDLGYAPEEAQVAINSVGALNLGSVAKVVDKTMDGGDFIQVHDVGDNDKRSHVRTDIYSQVSADPSLTLKQTKIGSNVVLYGMGIDNKMQGFLLEDSGFNEPGLANMLSVKNQNRDDPTGHGIEGYLRITRRRPDDGLNTLQRHPATQMVRQFIERAITGSIHQAEGKGQRDLTAIVEALATDKLTPDAIEVTGARMKEEKQFYDWMSSLAPENAATRLRQRLQERGMDPADIDRIAPLPENGPAAKR